MHIGFQNLPKCSENRIFSFVMVYKSEFFPRLLFRKSQCLNLPPSSQKYFAVMVIPRKLQNIAAPMLGQLCRQHQKLVADRFDGCCEILPGQTEALKPMDHIVSKQQQLQKGHVCHPLLRGNFVQRKRTEQLADGAFHVGSRLVSFHTLQGCKRRLVTRPE